MVLSPSFLETNKVLISDVIKDESWTPTVGLEVQYNSDYFLSATTPTSGHPVFLSPSQTSSTPIVYAPSLPAKTSYVLICTDPDATSRANPTRAEWLHWIVIGEKTTDPRQDLGRGTEIVRYAGPSPPPKTKLHRYVFILCERHSTTTAAGGYPLDLGSHSAVQRNNWKAWNFIQRNQLNPVGINLFESQNIQQ